MTAEALAATIAAKPADANHESLGGEPFPLSDEPFLQQLGNF